MKIGMIGHFALPKEAYDGQIIKTREIKACIEKKLNTNINIYDTYKRSKNLLKLFFSILNLLKDNDIVIVMVSNRGYKIITPIIMFLNKFKKKKLIEIVIGGTRYNLYKKNKTLLSLSKKYSKIFVETNTIKKEYLKYGLKNVDVMSNFKNIQKSSFNKTGKRIKLCIFSRIIKEKGIEESVNAVIKANNAIGYNAFSLDIYGSIGKKYKKEFNKLLISFPKYILYKGKINYKDSSKIISNYDIMLFLTYYHNEGFAGTFIDAFYAGVPVITTFWNSNEEIIKDEYNGILVNIKDEDAVMDKLIMLYNNIKLIDIMKNNSLKEADKYNVDKVIEKLIEEIKK